MPEEEHDASETRTVSASTELDGDHAPGREHDPVGRGAVIDRYVIGERLGVGGMGVVYRARDPELGRDVAMKFLRSGIGTDRRRARLLREARAMAQLRHRNVVSVHDVGEHDGLTWLAMEYIEGTTLRTEIAKGLSWDQALALFAGAGRGLASAHAVGIVHRDFKPDNVLIDRDGVAHVADFGLANAAADSAATESGEAVVSPVLDRLTHTGAVMGTPRYMAPEQHTGGEVTSAADQFAFCVALFEALYGRPPFAGKNVAELADNVLEGRLDPPPDGEVPKFVRDAVVRGLDVEPANRHSSMEALLAALAADPMRKRRVIAAAVALAVFVVGGGGAVVASMPGSGGDSLEDVCPLERGALAGTWDDTTRAALQNAFSKSDRGFSADSLRIAEAGLSSRAEAWLGERRRACIARRVDKTDGEDVYGQKTRCLERWRVRLRALVDGLIAADDRRIADAPRLVSSLPDVSDCHDPDVLRTQALFADDPRIDGILDDWARAQQIFQLGDTKRTEQLSTQLLARAEEVGTPGIVGRMQLFRARVLDRYEKDLVAEPLLRKAVENLSEAGQELEVARAWEVLYGVAVTHQDWKKTETLALAVRAAFKRLPATHWLRTNFLVDRGRELDARGDTQGALEAWRRARDMRVALNGEEDDDVTDTIVNIAGAHIRLRQYDRAEEMLLDALARTRRAFGPNHPDEIDIQHNLGVVYEETLQYDKSLAARLRALELTRSSYGEDTREYANIARGVAFLYENIGQYDKALGYARDALATSEGLGDPLEIGKSRMVVATQLAQLERTDEAVAMLRRAFDELPEGNMWRGLVLGSLANAYGRVKDWRHHCVAARDTYDFFRNNTPADSRFRMYGFLFLSQCKVETGAHREAIAIATEALEKADTLRANDYERSLLEIYRGRALWESGRDRKAGLAQVRTARERLAGIDDKSAREAVSEVDTWLAKHGLARSD